MDTLKTVGQIDEDSDDGIMADDFDEPDEADSGNKNTLQISALVKKMNLLVFLQMMSLKKLNLKQILSKIPKNSSYRQARRLKKKAPRLQT